MNYKILLILIIYLLLAQGVFAQDSMFASIDVPAVTSEGQGIMTNLQVEVVPGKGRILVNSAPLTGMMTQDSERTAVDIAAEYTGFNFSEYDVIFSLITNATSVDGPSAGTAMSIATIAAVQGKELREDASVTGTIEKDGSIGFVGGIIEKASTSAEAGKDLLLIPRGQGLMPVAVFRTETLYPGWTVTSEDIALVNTSAYSYEKYNIIVLEVEDIDGVADILIEDEVEVTEHNVSFDIVYPLRAAEVTEDMQTMQVLINRELQEATASLNEANELLMRSSMTIEQRFTLQAWMDNSNENLGKALEANESGYLYGAANYAFKSKLDSGFVLNVLEYQNLDSESQVEYLGDKVTEVKIKLDETKEKLEDIEKLTKDAGSYEWALVAEQRLAQAEKRFEMGSNDSSTIFYTVGIVDEWVEIADDFYEIAEAGENKTRKNTTVFINKSQQAIYRAHAETAQFNAPSTEYGPGWYLDVSLMEYSNGWYIASYVDAKLAVERLETNRELNTRSWEHIVNYVDEEIESIDTGDSAWATMYRDYAKLQLYHAVNEKDTDKIRESLTYARIAEVYANTKEEFEGLPVAGPELEDEYLNVFFVGMLFIALVLGMITYKSMRKVSKLVKKPKWKRKSIF